MRWAVVEGASLVSVLALGDLPRLRRQFRQLAPTGTVFAVGFGATAMSLRTSLSVGRYDYSAFKSLDLGRDYVFLHSALGGTYFVLRRTGYDRQLVRRDRRPPRKRAATRQRGRTRP